MDLCEENVRFLGFIDRKDQLILLKNALSVIQPSLFEGWSTVVEDVKSMNHCVILSDLPVHKEQMTENVVFFDRLSETDLAEKMLGVINNGFIIKPIDYEKAKIEFANTILSVFRND